MSNLMMIRMLSMLDTEINYVKETMAMNRSLLARLNSEENKEDADRLYEIYENLLELDTYKQVLIEMRQQAAEGKFSV